MALARLAVATAIWRVPLPDLPAPPVWRVVERPELHVGVRPVYDVGGVGLSIQVTTKTPW
jgi:hypothetical protein